MNDLYLQHHGVLGQKWGVRQYQNADGSLTAAGRRRYQVGKHGGIRNIKTAKGIQRRLNDLDAGLARNKAVVAKSKKEDKVAKAKKQIEHGRLETEKLLKKAKAYDMNVTEFSRKRSTMRGKDWAEAVAKISKSAGITGAAWFTRSMVGHTPIGAAAVIAGVSAIESAVRAISETKTANSRSGTHYIVQG